jgi:flavin reductase (DIM6/NTAB) family NADH-FMN oxidoreductase RutF
VNAPDDAAAEGEGGAGASTSRDAGASGVVRRRSRGRQEQTGRVTAKQFREAVGRFATGVTVVTTRVDGVDHAMTANAFTSVSIEPLLVLVCVEKITRFHEAILRAQYWGVSVLSDAAQDTSTWFATRGRPLDNQLEDFAYHRVGQSGIVIFADALAGLECRTDTVHDAGDHSIVIGQVLSVVTPEPSGRPLLYFRGRYHALGASG